MANIYLLTSKNVEKSVFVARKLLQNYSKLHKNIALFIPILSDEKREFVQNLLVEFNLNQNLEQSYSFSLNEALEKFAKDEDKFLNEIIEKYEDLKLKNDFVLALGEFDFGILGALESNTKIAKNLNTPLVAITCEHKRELAKKFLSNTLKGQNFALIDENFNFDEICALKNYDFTTPARFKFELLKKIKQEKKTIVLPESEDERILRAAEILLKDGLVNLILLGDENKISKKAAELNLNLNGFQSIDPLNSALSEEFANILFELRKNKGLSLENARELVQDKNYFGTLLVHTKRADAMVSGANNTTADTIRPALQIIKTKEGINSVSGIFFMALEDKILAFADCAVNPNPSPAELAQSAYVSAQTAKAFNIESRIAMLSYSSGDSGKGQSVDLVKEALKIAREKYPELEIDGPMQFDCAIDEKTAAKKMPNSKIAGKATIYIFPDLDAANICYKAVQRTANALAIGPLLQGLKKPVNDLSRGCLVADIVDTVLLSAIQA